jgi:hypothetical protein
VRDAPLKESAVLVAAISLIAWPLHRLTADPPPSADDHEIRVPTDEGAGLLPTLIQVRAAHAFDAVEIRMGETLVGRIDGPDRSGEIELEFDPHGEPLRAEVRFPSGSPETAVRFEVWPEAHETREVTFWGEGEVRETLDFHWHE